MTILQLRRICLFVFFTIISYIQEYKNCFTNYTQTCSNETLAQFDSQWGFRGQLWNIHNTLDVCNYDPCDPDPCNGNGRCINLVS